MQLIIPMTGQGSRFIAAGYERLKPFILIHDKPLLWWVLKMFPSIEKNKIILILRKDHFENLSYIEPILKEIAPKAKVFLIDQYDKRGPVPNILKAAPVIDDQLPTFVSYCDYYMQWNFEAYCTTLASLNPDGAIPCYSGFHPHLIPKSNLYASCKTDMNEYLMEIKEKFSFTEDKSLSLHSPGTYYFKTGALLKAYYQKAIRRDLSINGEFYCSLPYNLMVEDQLKVYASNNVLRFCQWGTPQDLQDYLFWIKLLKREII